MDFSPQGRFDLVFCTIMSISFLTILNAEKSSSCVVCAPDRAGKGGIFPNTNSQGTSQLTPIVLFIILIDILSFEFSSSFA